MFKHICYIINCERGKDMKCNSSFLTKEGCDTSSYRSHKTHSHSEQVAPLNQLVLPLKCVSHYNNLL